METPSPTQSETQRTTQSKIWKCGDPSQYTIPLPNGNPWKICLQPLLEEDRVKCERWEDEVQSLLLFAGLFSAVVTAFVVQSYQALQADENQASIALLATIVEQLNHLANGTSAGISANYSQTYSAPFYPSASSIRINIYWFLSLILSLMTVLIGIVALQWLREYKRHPSSSSSKHTFAARNLRAEAFDEWCVPEILAGLPLLLQAALILFFVGLIDFLLALNAVVAIPVIGLIAITLFFLSLTTILPMFQTFWLLLRVTKPKSLSNQCPYKSPQSLIFLHLASSRFTRFTLNFVGNVVFNSIFVGIGPLIFVSRVWDLDRHFWKFVGYLQITSKLKSLSKLRSWTHFDDFWLDERHRIVTQPSSKPGAYFTKLTIGDVDYDAARGIAHVINDGHSRDETLAFAAYHCFQQIPEVAIKDHIFRLMTQSLPGWMISHQSTRKASMLEFPSANMVREENEMFLLGRLPQTTIMNPIHIFRKRQLELFVRTLAYIYTGDPWSGSSGIDYDLTIYSRPQDDRRPGKLLVPVCMKTPKGISQLPDSMAADLREQLSMIFQSFITASMTGEDRFRTSRFYYSEEMLGDFMQIMHTITLSTVKYTQISSSSSMQHMTTLSNLTDALNILNAALRSPMSTNTNSIFYISMLYISRFEYTEWALICRRVPTFSAAFKELVTSLQLCEQSSLCQVTFSVHPHYYRKQWEVLVNEVLSGEQSPVFLDHFQTVHTDTFAISSTVRTWSESDHHSPTAVQPPPTAKLRFSIKPNIYESNILPNGIV